MVFTKISQLLTIFLLCVKSRRNVESRMLVFAAFIDFTTVFEKSISIFIVANFGSIWLSGKANFVDSLSA